MDIGILTGLHPATVSLRISLEIGEAIDKSINMDIWTGWLFPCPRQK